VAPHAGDSRRTRPLSRLSDFPNRCRSGRNRHASRSVGTRRAETIVTRALRCDPGNQRCRAHPSLFPIGRLPVTTICHSYLIEDTMLPSDHRTAHAVGRAKREGGGDRMFRMLLAAIIVLTAAAQTQVDLRTQAKNVDFTAATTTKPVKTARRFRARVR